MKNGDKFVNRTTRKRITIRAKYREQISKKTVVQYYHGKDRAQWGALYKDDFIANYRPLKP